MGWPQEVTKHFSIAVKTKLLTMNSTSSETTFWSAGMIKAYSDKGKREGFVNS